MLEAIQADIFAAFKDLVRERRGDRLKGLEDDLFSGAFWSGRGALELGLIDGIGNARTVLRERFGERVRLRPVAGRRSWLRRRFGADSLAAGLAGRRHRGGGGTRPVGTLRPVACNGAFRPFLALFSAAL